MSEGLQHCLIASVSTPLDKMSRKWQIFPHSVKLKLLFWVRTAYLFFSMRFQTKFVLAWLTETLCCKYQPQPHYMTFSDVVAVSVTDTKNLFFRN